MISYAVKRVLAPSGFSHAVLRVALATAFFAGINVGADTTAKAVLIQPLKRIPIDITVYSYSPQHSANEWKPSEKWRE